MANSNFQVNGIDADSLFIKKSDIYTVNDRTLWGWGDNTYAALGLGYESTYSTFISFPIQVGSLTNWKQVSGGGYFSSAIKQDGTLWTWGQPVAGLGLNGSDGGGVVSSPTQVGSLTNWSKVACGGFYTAAIKTDGTLWSWGDNTSGQLGLGNTTNLSSPVQVGTLTNWNSVVVSNGATIATKTDGTLWSWGFNYYGRLGLGDTTHRSSPVQVGSLTNWSKIAAGLYHTAAIKTDGTLWTWGYNNYGALGLGNTNTVYSPVQVGSLTNWSNISCCGGGYTAAIKTDGTLWTWGLNYNGQLGHYDRINRSSPVQVGTLTNWSKVAGGPNHVVAIKTDGSMWAWGSGGALGLGDTTHRSSPVQVGSLTSWSDVFITQGIRSFALGSFN